MRSPAATLALLALATGACARREPADERPNFLVVDIDTLRADRVLAERAGEPVAPILAALAARGARFDQAFSQSGWTVPGLAALLTGRYPLVPTAPDTGLAWVEQGARTVPEILSWYGYDTAAFWGGTLGTDYEGPSRGFARVGRGSGSGDAGYHREVVEWLGAEAREPFFAFVHNIDLHAPSPPIPARDLHRWGRPVAGCAEAPHLRALFGLLVPALGPEAALAHVAQHYDAGLRAYGRSLRAILDALTTRGVAERTVVVVTSNHGEDLGEHGTVDHGLLYDTVLRVPLLVVDPERVRPETTVDTVVQAVDLAPTLLARAGLSPDLAMDGQSLLPLLGAASGDYQERPVFFLSSPANLGVRTRAVKLFQTNLDAGLPGDAAARQEGHRPPRWHLYDLVADPGEQRDLWGQAPALAAEPSTLLEHWRGVIAARAEGAETLPVDDAARRRLQERGYWSLVTDAPASPDQR